MIPRLEATCQLLKERNRHSQRKFLGHDCVSGTGVARRSAESAFCNRTFPIESTQRGVASGPPLYASRPITSEIAA